MRNNAGQQCPLLWTCAVVGGGLRGVAWFYSSAFEVNSFSCALLPFTVLGDFAPCPPSLSGKYKVSIMVPLFFSVTVPGGCRSQGCHGYPTRSALVLEAPPSFQAPSPSSSIVDEFKPENGSQIDVELAHLQQVNFYLKNEKQNNKD